MPQLVIEVIGDASNLERTFRRVNRQTESFGRKMGRMAGVGVFAGATAGIVGLTAALKVGFDEMAEGEKAAAQTAAALKSTGRVAGVTAKQIEDLAGSIQRYSGADDEAVQGAENLLLTFTRIRNEVGQGNDIFNQTTKAVVDLSTRFDQDLSTSAVQLGKALNDPARGLTALRRIGISFSDAQVRMINQLTTTGNTLEAQKLILREVNREVGGSAKAFGQTLPGQIQILRGSLENLAGDLLETLNPEIKKLTTRFNEWLANPENKKKVIDDWTTSVHLLGDAFGAAADGVGFLKSAWDKLPDFGKDKGLAELLHLDVHTSITDLLGARTDLWRKAAGGDFGGGGDFGVGPTSRFFFTDTPPSGAAGPFGTSGSGTAGMTARQIARLREQAAVRGNTWFDNMIDRLLGRAGDPRSLKGQIGRLNTVAGLLQQRIRATRDVTRRLRLQDELADVLIMIRDRQDERRQNALAARKASRQKQQDILAANLADLPELGVAGGPLTVAQVNAAMARRQRAGFDRRLSWAQFAAERAEATKGTRDDLKAARMIEKILTDQIKVEGRTLELVRQRWQIRQKIQDINKKQADEFTKTNQLSNRQITNILAAGLGLGAGGRSRLLFNVAKSDVALNVGVEIDGREVGRAVRKDTSRTGYRTSRQTSGFRG